MKRVAVIAIAFCLLPSVSKGQNGFGSSRAANSLRRGAVDAALRLWAHSVATYVTESVKGYKGLAFLVMPCLNGDLKSI